MLDNDNWATEICDECGSAFSLKITEKLHEEQTAFQKIAIYATEKFGNLMVIDGFYMLTGLDNFIYHEMLSHPALFSHPAPENVVIIGGGDCGTLHEVVKHRSVTRVLQVEIDERVTRLAEQYFPELCVSNNDARVEFLFDDGIRWMQQAEAGSVDVVIVDSTDPIGPAEGLFTEAFYCDCNRALGDNGILVQQSESPLFHMDIIMPMRKAMQAAGFRETRTLFFPQPCYPSGWWTATMAVKQAASAQYRESAVQHKAFETRYYNAAIHQAALTPPEFFTRAVEDA